jgi:tRNA (guanine-N7-)-methyltransferase
MRKAARALGREGARELAARVMLDFEDYCAIDLTQIFGRSAPVELEIGAGRGDFIIERARSMPERDFLAVELASTVAQLMALRAGRRELTNVRVVRLDARPLVNLILADRSLSACHIYFPDPWPKERHVKNRLFTPYFAESLRRVLREGAPAYLASDVQDYAEAIFAMLHEAGFSRIESEVPGATQTGFARRFIEQRLQIYAGAFASY